ncbi:hypothetical protein ACFL2Y_01060 [Candidatus Omnitrophota bacterium]
MSFKFVGSILILFFLIAPVCAQDYSTPRSTFEIFKEAAKSNDVQAYIDCTTRESQEMLSQRRPNSSQMNNEYRDISDKEYKIEIKGNSATLFLIPETPCNPPYFFKKENGQWKIDLIYMSENIYFDSENNWHWRKQ